MGTYNSAKILNSCAWISMLASTVIFGQYPLFLLWNNIHDIFPLRMLCAWEWCIWLFLRRNHHLSLTAYVDKVNSAVILYYRSLNYRCNAMSVTRTSCGFLLYDHCILVAWERAILFEMKEWNVIPALWRRQRMLFCLLHRTRVAWRIRLQSTERSRVREYLYNIDAPSRDWNRY